MLLLLILWKVFKDMFQSLCNSLFISFWSGKKKVGPDKNVLLTKSCETYADTVYDLKWTLKYIHEDGKVSHPVTITERASKWNVRSAVHKIEKTKLPKEIERLIRRHTNASDKESYPPR